MLTTILVPIILSLFSKVFPSDESWKYDINYLRITYKKWDYVALVSLLIFGSILVFVWYKIITLFISISNERMENIIYSITPENAYWFIPAIFLAIITSAIPINLMFKIILKDKYSEYIAYSNSMYKADGLKVFTLLSFIIVPLCILFIIFGINWYTYFTTDKIYNNDYFSFKESIHSYKDIKNIYKVEKYKAPNGNIIEEPYYVILFTDNYRLNMRPKPISTKLFEDNILGTIINESSKTIDTIELIDEINKP